MKKIYYIIIGLIIVIGSIFMFIKTNNKNTNLTTIKVAEVTHSAFYTPFYIAIKDENDNFIYGNEEIVQSFEGKLDEAFDDDELNEEMLDDIE